MEKEKSGLTPEEIAEVVDIIMPWVPKTDPEKEEKPVDPEIENIINNM